MTTYKPTSLTHNQHEIRRHLNKKRGVFSAPVLLLVPFTNNTDMNITQTMQEVDSKPTKQPFIRSFQQWNAVLSHFKIIWTEQMCHLQIAQQHINFIIIFIHCFMKTLNT